MKVSQLSKVIATLLLGASALSPVYAAHDGSAATYRPDVTFTLRTDIADGKLVFMGETGDIKGQVNPQLMVPEGAVVQINLVNGDGAIHDIAIPQFGVDSDDITGKGASTAVVFRANKKGEFEYLCTLPGHKQAGMAGKLVVGGTPGTRKKATVTKAAQAPTDGGKPVDNGGPRKLAVEVETGEGGGQREEGTTKK